LFASLLIALNDTGERSEAKLGTLLFGHCPFYRFDLILDPHKVITVELAGLLIAFGFRSLVSPEVNGTFQRLVRTRLVRKPIFLDGFHR
jgi:hypothetical protein